MSKFPPKKPDNSHIIIPRQVLNWSEYQKAIFRDIAKGEGHTIVEAYAGASKTSSLIESLRYIPRGKKAMLFAFNKKIQEELQARSPGNYTTALTFHSCGLRAIKQRFGNVEIDDNKMQNIVKDLLGSDYNFDLCNNICDTVAFCKYGLLDAPSQIDSIIDNFGIDLCDEPRPQFISYVIKALGMDKNMTNTIDFNDMCWFPFVYNLDLGQYDFVYIDERQDLNKSQLVMAKKACKKGTGRMIVIGDAFQALYSWRLADTSIFEDIKKEKNTKVLKLPISYRCPKKVIELSKNWVPDIQCPDTAIEGEINDISVNELYDKASPGCFILSRTNAPMIKICMNFIKRGIKANIRGRDVGKQLAYLVKKSKKKKISAFLDWLQDWKDEEVERLLAKKISTDNVLDRYECLTNLCDECTTLEEVVTKVNALFNDTDEKNVIILSTVHRAKGLEKDDIFILRWTFKAWLDNIGHLDPSSEEGNIAYVAATRTKKRLFIVKKI